MNTFFYSPRAAECRNNCVYYACPQRCLSRLRGISALQEMVVLHGSLHTVLPFNMWLRSGDLMLLFAASWHELEQLISMQDVFESFRVVLILGSDEFLADYYRYHQLKPRFIVSLNTNMLELESVVNRMLLVTASDNV